MDPVTLGMAKSDAARKFATRSVSLQGSEKIKRMADAPSYAPTLMSAVPTVVQSATQNPANTKTVTYTDPAFQWPGFVDVAGGSATPRHYTKQDGSGVAAGVPVTQVAFDYDGQQFDAVIKAVVGMKYRVWVNERAATTGLQSITETGALAYFNIDLGSASVGVPRRIVIELESPSTPINFYGIRTPGTATTIAPSIRSPRVMLVGDSYGGGAGGTQYAYGYGRTLARLMGWADMWTAYTSISSTGLVKDASSSVGRYITRLAGDVIPHNPDLVIVQGSLNDNPYVGQGVIGPALETYVNTLKAAHPNCVVVATSPLYVGDPPASYLQIRDEMQPVAATLGIPFIDMLTPKIFGGSGKVGGTTGNGNADFYRSNDGTHATNEGHNVIAAVEAGKLGRALGLAT